LTSRTRTILILVGALVIGIASRFFLFSGPPHVEVAAEKIFELFPGYPVTNSLIITFVVDIILIGVAFAATRNMQMVPRGLQNLVEVVLEFLYGIFRNINEKYVDKAFPLVATLFLFVLIGNWLGLVPGFGPIGACEAKEEGHSARIALVQPGEGMGSGAIAAESDVKYDTCPEGTKLVPFFRSPSADLNFTFAISAIAFVFIEYWGFRTLGPGYLSKFFNLKGIMSFVGIIEFISEIVKPFALAFRLFGNIFAGEVLLLVMAFLVPLMLPLPFYVFETFVGFIQAVIFSVLTMAFLNIAVTSHDEHEEGGAH
jgi:F-type H+-transporting ATPase subunit a